MTSLNQQLVKLLLSSKSIQWALLIVILLIGLFTASSYQSFIYLQAQNISYLSLYNEMIKPLTGLTLIGMIILNLLLASQLFPYFCSRGQQCLWLHSSSTSANLIGQTLLSMSKINLLLLCYYVLILISLGIYSAPDTYLLIASSMALFLISLLFALLFIAMTFFFTKPLAMLVASSLILTVILLLDAYVSTQANGFHLSFYQTLLLNFREGLLSLFDLLIYAFWLLLLFQIGCIQLNHLRGLATSHNKRLIITGVTALLLLGSFYDIFTRKDFKAFYWDITQQKENSLAAADYTNLTAIKAPIKITAVIDNEQHKDEIRNAFRLLNQYHNNSQLMFKSRQAFVAGQKNASSKHMDQFVSINIDGVSVSQRFPFEQNAKHTLIAMINQITQRSSKWITFIEGHGEASPFSSSNRDMSVFYQRLKDEQWPVAVQNLSNQGVITDNTQLLVLAAGQQKWLPQETQSLLQYLNRGGNLLLLREMKDLLPLEIENFLAIKKVPGILIDWRGYQSGTPHPAVLIINQFPKHPINSNINSLLALPWSVGLKVSQPQSSDSRIATVLQSHKGVWNELDSEQTDLAFSPQKGEKTQTFPVAISLQNRKLKQRIVVVGDASFLSDGAIKNYANEQFAMNLIHWLSESPTKPIVRASNDHYIQLTRFADLLFRWGFSVIFPLILLVIILTSSLSSRFARTPQDRRK